MIYVSVRLGKQVARRGKQSLARKRTNATRRARMKYLTFKVVNYLGLFFNLGMVYKTVMAPGQPTKQDVLILVVYAMLSALWAYRSFIQFRGYTAKNWE